MSALERRPGLLLALVVGLGSTGLLLWWTAPQERTDAAAGSVVAPGSEAREVPNPSDEQAATTSERRAEVASRSEPDARTAAEAPGDPPEVEGWRSLSPLEQERLGVVADFYGIGLQEAFERLHWDPGLGRDLSAPLETPSAAEAFFVRRLHESTVDSDPDRLERRLEDHLRGHRGARREGGAIWKEVEALPDDDFDDLLRCFKRARVERSAALASVITRGDALMAPYTLLLDPATGLQIDPATGQPRAESGSIITALTSPGGWTIRVDLFEEDLVGYRDALAELDRRIEILVD